MKSIEKGSDILEINSELSYIAILAGTIGYSLELYSFNDDKIILLSEISPASRHWGTYAFRLSNNSSDYLIESPRPLYEPYAIEFSYSLFSNLRAKYLLLSSAHPYTNTDLSSDLIRLDNKKSILNLAHQTILRAESDNPASVIQVRSSGFREGVSVAQDILLSTSEFDSNMNIEHKSSLESLKGNLQSELQKAGLSVGMVTGDETTAGYEVGYNLQEKYMRFTKNKTFYLLWLTENIRKKYIIEEKGDFEEKKFEAASIQTEEFDLLDHIKTKSFKKVTKETITERAKLIENFNITKDVLLLEQLVQKSKDKMFLRVIDTGTRKSYIVISSGSEIELVASLDPITNEHYEPEQLDDFINYRGSLLYKEQG